ncbi:MAG TPA: VOC family protein [Candidatus Paceibacterota bacterium]|nr:VOC family protein [Candidatus Paceibacterota bacterium]
MQKITTFLWFNENAEEAVKFYMSIFKNSKIVRTSYCTDSVAKRAGQPAGSVLTIEFKLNGQNFIALNGGPHKFTEAISLMVYCDTQAELDRYWKKLTSGGGEEVACGWLKDKYGLSWQIVPKSLIKLISDKDPAKVDRVMQAVMSNVKLDFKRIKAAATRKSKTK